MRSSTTSACRPRCSTRRCRWTPSCSASPQLAEPSSTGRRWPPRTTPTDGRDEVRRAALVSKLLLNVFATGSGKCRRRSSPAGRPTPAGSSGARLRAAAPLRGRGRRRLGRRCRGIGAALGAIEGDLVKRMHLREVLADPALARQLTPSMSLIEQLLRDKANLVRRGPGQRQGADPPVRRRGRRGAAHPGASRPASARSTGPSRRSGCSATSTSSAPSGRT